MSTGSIEHASPNQRLGLVLFAIYFALYAGFIGITVYDYRIMARPVFAGINLAVTYGIGLIVAAIVLAVIYALLARHDDRAAYEPDGRRDS
jgi:uncharacterized membrane protein (DUF485 family)